MKQKAKIGGLVLALSTISSTMYAADLGTANQFNAFVFGNASTNGGHSDGAMAIGGNWTGSGYDALQFPLPASLGSTPNIGLYVGGDVTFSGSGSVNSGGNAYVNGSFTGNTFNMNGGTLFYGGTATGVNGSKVNLPNTVDPGVFSDQLAYSLDQSEYLASLTSQAINTSDPNNWNVNAASQSGPLKLYSISASSLNLLRTLNFSNLAAADTVVINVIGANVSGFGITVNTNTGSYARLLWNFETATSITINQRAFHGSMLAPLASVFQSQNIDGNLIAANLTVTGGAELHNGATSRFTGEVPVPEPSTLFAAGLGIAALLRKRRKPAK